MLRENHPPAGPLDKRSLLSSLPLKMGLRGSVQVGKGLLPPLLAADVETRGAWRQQETSDSSAPLSPKVLLSEPKDISQRGLQGQECFSK